MLWDPDAHERLVEDAWSETRALDAVRAIAADAEDAFADGWPAHPLDAEDGDAGPWGGTYLGGAGVVDALRRLAAGGLIELRRDYVPYLERAEPDAPGPSLMVGETGIRLVRHRLAPSAETSARLRELVEANAGDEHRELVWGSPGTILAARELGFDDLVQASSEQLLAARDPETGLWTQVLHGRTGRYIGPAHGFAGCVLALGAVAAAAETARRYAIVEDGLANWPPHDDGELVRNGTIRLQWCHGAPGMITSLGDLLDEDLALAGAELTWRAGPLAKGAGLCHGTAGNGYAFLTLFERTGDELWLDRARRFAVHAIAQVERARAEHGRGRYSLWTGDPGTALYLADCVAGGGALPLP
ncbi:MAG TPA: LanC-like protein [Gaiellaceae bacterium]|nr:LanC-like protein [Gaiellaceae bacterium]